MAPGPRRSPTCSIDWPTTAAKAAMARPETTKRATSGAPTATATPAARVKHDRADDGQSLRSPKGIDSAGHVGDFAPTLHGARVTLYSKLPAKPRAAWPSGPGKGLQSPLQRFDSARRLQR